VAEPRLAFPLTREAVAAGAQALARLGLRVQGLLAAMEATPTYRVPLREIH